jgi:hypothetical protein
MWEKEPKYNVTVNIDKCHTYTFTGNFNKCHSYTLFGNVSKSPSHTLMENAKECHYYGIQYRTSPKNVQQKKLKRALSNDTAIWL